MNPKFITILGEYKVSDDKKSDYLELLSRIKQSLEILGADEVVFFEGTDQPGLFVEKFNVPDMETYIRIKFSRYEESSSVWKQLHRCVPGGKTKLHFWSFSKIELRNILEK